MGDLRRMKVEAARALAGLLLLAGEWVAPHRPAALPSGDSRGFVKATAKSHYEEQGPGAAEDLGAEARGANGTGRRGCDAERPSQPTPARATSWGIRGVGAQNHTDPWAAAQEY